MEQRSSETKSRLPVKKSPYILWNPKVHYRVHKSPLDESSPHPHIIFFKIQFSICFSNTTSSPRWSLTFRFPDWNSVCISHVTFQSQKPMI